MLKKLNKQPDALNFGRYHLASKGSGRYGFFSEPSPKKSKFSLSIIVRIPVKEISRNVSPIATSSLTSYCSRSVD